MKEDIISSTKKSILWSVIGKFGSQAMTVISTFVLARLIAPNEFGLIAMITVFSNFAIIFIDVGFSSALIFKKNICKRDIDTVFFINVCSAFFLSLLFYFGAEKIAAFYKQQELNSLIKATSPIFLIIAVSGVNKTIAKKHLKFKKINIIESSSILIGIAIAIVFAYFEYNAWSIIFQMISTQLSSSILYLIFFPIKQSFKFYKKEFNELFSYGKNIIAQTSISYVTRSSDQALAGKMVGNEALGLYTKGFSIVMIPITSISTLINQVMFSSISILQSDIKAIQRLFLKCVLVTIFITFPLLIIVAASAKEFVLTLFGIKWIGMIPLIKYLCIIAGFRSLNSMNSTTYNAMGQPKLNFQLSIVFNIIILSLIFIGLLVNDLIGMLQFYVLALTLVTVIDFYFIIKIIKINFTTIFSKVTRTLLICSLCYIFIIIFQNLYSSNSILLNLVLKASIGICVYLVTSWFFQKEIILSLISLINPKNL